MIVCQQCSMELLHVFFTKLSVKVYVKILIVKLQMIATSTSHKAFYAYSKNYISI